jgi:hypoxanthine phosphoribosyltransferase
MTTPSFNDCISLMEKVYADICVRNLKRSGKANIYTKVIAIERGGVPFGKYLAHKFGLELETITIKFRDAANNLLPQPFTEGVGRAGKTKSVFLLVDDIVDSGATVKYFEENTGFRRNCEFDLATLHYHWQGTGDILPTFFGELKPDISWITYPWERPLSFDEVWPTVVNRL